MDRTKEAMDAIEHITIFSSRLVTLSVVRLSVGSNGAHATLCVLHVLVCVKDNRIIAIMVEVYCLGTEGGIVTSTVVYIIENSVVLTGL